jgi:CBS domain-containing protein
MSRFDSAVRRSMTAPPITIPAAAMLAEAERRLREHDVASLPVVEGGRLVGLISRTDVLGAARLRATMARAPEVMHIPNIAVTERMTRDVITTYPHTSVADAAAKMQEARIHQLVVVDGDHGPIGMFTTRDVMRTIVEERSATPISELASRPVMSVEVDTALGVAVDELRRAKIHGVVVVEQGWPVGLFTQIEALAARDLPPETPVEETMSCALLCLPLGTPAFRAAALALDTRARRVLAVDARQTHGILTPFDFLRAAIAEPS